MLCITCCVDYNEAKNGDTRAKAKQWCKDKKLVAKKFKIPYDLYEYYNN